MRALTVWRPWDYALVFPDLALRKHVENRPQRPWAELIGKRIALHAGLKYDYTRLAAIKNALGIEVMPEREAGVIFATTTLAGWVEKDTTECREHGVDVLMSSPELEWAVRDRWFFGPVGLVLRDTRPLPKPVTARGMQGFWPVSEDVEARIRAQLGEPA